MMPTYATMYIHVQNACLCLFGIVTDNGNRGQPACPEEWKMCKVEHEW